MIGVEEGTYANLGSVYYSLGDYRKVIDYLEKYLKIAIEIGDRDGEREAYEISVMFTSHCVTIEKPLSMMKSI